MKVQVATMFQESAFVIKEKWWEGMRIIGLIDADVELGVTCI